MAWTAAGCRLSQVALTACNVALVTLRIQLGRGTIEFHFGLFVLLGQLLVYRDWFPIMLGAGPYAVHHVAFDRLQALNLGVFCTPTPDFLRTSMHAIYVVVQTGIEIFLAHRLRKAAVRRERRDGLAPGRRGRCQHGQHRGPGTARQRADAGHPPGRPLDRVTQQNAELVEESAAAADGLRDQAMRLNEVVGRFALE